ncbi:unnamed protein product [Hymenolepis diminuta]|uniref:Uncharacterized protein n=1 Tax=Hymenolepis diminuta TaxID=6216 RepID=A0A0R3SYZ5_HYMDI|nr:unnamed protein product [Hymenolepis diminuta]VUZ48075.1 unnamed protein product [Hymenolepis diminuta]
MNKKTKSLTDSLILRARIIKKTENGDLLAKINIECSVTFQTCESGAPNQEKRKGQVELEGGGSNCLEAESCSRELLDGCSSRTWQKISIEVNNMKKKKKQTKDASITQ